MNVPSPSRAVTPGIALFLAFVAGGAAGATAHRPVVLPVQRVYPAERQLRPVFDRGRETTVVTCNADSSTNEFVALPGNNDYAGANITSVLGGENDEACDSYSSVVAGSGNVIGNNGNADSSFIGAGGGNHITNEDAAVAAGFYNSAGGQSAFIGAGSNNAATGDFSTDVAGYENTASGQYSFVGAGNANSVSANYAFVGAGNMNVVSASAVDSTIAGGDGNTVSGQKASLGGGEANQVSGSFAVVPGGYHDEAVGNESFAAGSQAEARYAGSFVWSDYVSGERALADSAAGEFVARASGGVYFFSNAAASTGVHLAAGSGTWSSLSDRNAKTGIVPLDDASILAKVAALPISAWRYKTERGVRHVGPMAQDFYAAFRIGEDDRHITSIDEDGIALAAIKALHRENATLRRKNVVLQTGFDDLRARVERLEALSRLRPIPVAH